MHTHPPHTPPADGLDLDALRAALLERRAALCQDLQPGDAERESGHEVSDQKDAAARREADDLADAQQRLELAALRDVDAALQRLADGSFGRCASCGEAIPAARLRANPAARRCAPCQAAHEAGPAHPHTLEAQKP